MSKEDRFKEFQKAVEEGNVELMMGGTEDILFTDGDAGLMLVQETHGMGDFGFTAFDGGGFTGMFITREQWTQMKKRVDDFIELKWGKAQ